MDYIKDSQRTLSPNFYPELVPVEHMLLLLHAAEEVGNELDLVKKALFYGKPLPEASVMNLPTSTKFDINGLYVCSMQKDYENIRDLLHGLLGIITEAGEMASALKKLLLGTPDLTNITEESGDILWYMARICQSLDTDFAEIAIRNLNKLKARFPEKFEQEQALVRNVDAEMEALSKALDPQ